MIFKIDSLIELHHTSNHVYTSWQYNYYLANNMNTVAQLNQSVAQLLPLYGTLYNFFAQQINQSIESFNKLYQGSADRVTRARKVSNRFNKQAIWLLSQSAEELIDLIEFKLKIIHDQTSDMRKTTRLIKIGTQLKEQYLMNPMRNTIQWNYKAINWIKALPNNYILPMYFTLKATIEVSRQIVMEMLTERLGQIKMTYKVSKDMVTMIFSDKFDQKKVLQQLNTNFNNYKSITVNFLKKGMEIKISKEELRQNLLAFADRMIESVREASEKSIVEWRSAKLRTLTLYNRVLLRIKEKEVVIKTEYFKKAQVMKVAPGLSQKMGVEETTSLLQKPQATYD